MKLKYILILILAVFIVFTVSCTNEASSSVIPDENEQEPSVETDPDKPQPSTDPDATDEPILTDTVDPEATPEGTQKTTPEDTQDAAPEDTPEIAMPPGPESNGIIIAIDPGHQRRGNYTQEKIGPGSTQTKPMVSSGTSGAATKIPEYELTLEISLQLRDELISRGYEVFMIRETHDVDISNSTRAEMAAESGASIFVRIHANGSTDSSSNGILTISPTSGTPFIPALYSRSRALSQCILDEMIETTGAKNRGIWETDSMTGINWSKIPVTIVELGFMTNHDEDRLMQTPEYQRKLVEGMANGIDFYFIFEFGD